MRNVVYLIAFFASGLVAADRPDVNGTWSLDAAHSGKGKLATLTIRQTADSVQVSEVAGPDGKNKKVDLECTVGGEQCKMKDAGEQVSFWYNDSALVMMEMRHGTDIVTKTRLVPSEDGKTLKMEVIHIAPAGQKDESYTLTRQGGI